MLLLFQTLTGDGWSAIMDDCMITPERGCSEEDGDCGTSLALPYFVSFFTLGGFVVLNLIVAVILDNFSSLSKQQPDLVTADHIEVFRDAWAEFDPDADGQIPTVELPELLLSRLLSRQPSWPTLRPMPRQWPRMQLRLTKPLRRRWSKPKRRLRSLLRLRTNRLHPLFG